MIFNKSLNYLIISCFILAGATPLHANNEQNNSWWKPVAITATLSALTYYMYSHFLPKKPGKKRNIIHHNTHNTWIEQKAHVNSTSNNITIWVHGTKAVGWAEDFIHATPKPGLTHISELSSWYRLKNLLTKLHEKDPVKFPYENLFVFGWSGSLSFEARKKEAHSLYNELITLVEDHTTAHGIPPTITFITHSHGGNVVLNLAHIRNIQDYVHAELVLLGCPVQHETKQLVHHPLFKKVYTFYTDNDWIQVLDPQGLYRTQQNADRHLEFSERSFYPAPHIYQTNVQGLYGHLDFIGAHFVEQLPDMLKIAQHNAHQANSSGILTHVI